MSAFFEGSAYVTIVLDSSDLTKQHPGRVGIASNDKMPFIASLLLKLSSASRARLHPAL